MNCQQCDRVTNRIRRGLCNACYQQLLRGGESTQQRLPAEYVITEWKHLSSFGLSRAQVAERLGITKKALEKALARHQKAQRQEAS